MFLCLECTFNMYLRCIENLMEILSSQISSRAKSAQQDKQLRFILIIQTEMCLSHFSQPLNQRGAGGFLKGHNLRPGSSCCWGLTALLGERTTFSNQIKFYLSLPSPLLLADVNVSVAKCLCFQFRQCSNNQQVIQLTIPKLLPYRHKSKGLKNMNLKIQE